MYILIFIMLAFSALADFPYHSNTGNFNATTNATGDFNAFSWQWMGYDDQRVNVNLLPSGYAMVYMRMCWPRRGTIFLEVTDGVLATTNFTASITRSNLPPNGVYYTEFIGFETTSTSSVARSLATGMINIQHSLFENTTQSTWTNPAAGTVIGPPIHTLSTLSLWPFVQTNQMGTGATWTGSNYTFAAGADDTSWRTSTQTWNTVTGKADTATLGGYVQTNDSRLTDNRTDGAAVHTNDTTYTQTVALADSAWQNPASATNWGWTSDGTEITLTNYMGPDAVVIPDMLDGQLVTGFGNTFKGGPVTSVTGGNNITSIGAQAFAACSSLQSVSLFNVSTVGSEAFQNCASLQAVNFTQNAPIESGSVYEFATQVVNYVWNPTATGWGTNWNERPVVRQPLYGNGSNLTGITAAQVGAVATNTVIRGGGYWLMGESGVTSILYHVTSGNHTNQVGTYYSE